MTLLVGFTLYWFFLDVWHQNQKNISGRWDFNKLHLLILTLTLCISLVKLSIQNFLGQTRGCRLPGLNRTCTQARSFFIAYAMAIPSKGLSLHLFRNCVLLEFSSHAFILIDKLEEYCARCFYILDVFFDFSVSFYKPEQKNITCGVSQGSILGLLLFPLLRLLSTSTYCLMCIELTHNFLFQFLREDEYP